MNKRNGMGLHIAPTMPELFEALIDIMSKYIASVDLESREERDAQMQALFDMNYLIEGRLPPKGDE